MAIEHGVRHAGHATGIRRRLSELLAGGGPVDRDPSEVVDAAVVHLAEGPLLVEGLRRAGIDAVGVESFSVLTNVRSGMRVQVRRGDLDAATEVLDRLRYEADDGQGFGGDEVNGDLAAADDLAQRAMGDLFLAADRLSHVPWDMELLVEVERLGSSLGEAPPFGIEADTWRELRAVSAAVPGPDDPADEDKVREAARALRSFLRDYV